MFTSTVEVLQNIIDDVIDGEHRVEAESAYDGLTSFEFVFILYLEKETMEITDELCQALQSQSQDILNAIHLVSSTKALIQKFRDDGWDGLLTTVISFVRSIALMSWIWMLVILGGEVELELNYWFNEDAMELLRLSSALEPREALKSFRSSDICLLVKNFYPQDFTNFDKQVLEKELYHFEHNVVQDSEFKKLKSLSELSQWWINDFEASQGTFFDLVGRILQKPRVLEIFATTAWFIWTHRNKTRLNEQTLPSCKISEAAKKFLLDFISSRVIQQVQKTAKKRTWVTPKPDEFKTNFAGAMFIER
nr:uncharacterized protein LOC112007453 [Quercus suber]